MVLLATSLWILAMRAPATAEILLADPLTFTEKRSWSAVMLGVPENLAGIRFSSDGSTLYVVGEADTPMSAVYAVPLVRDETSNEILELGMASSTPLFAANVSTSSGGLDSGPEEGPGGTLFYTYFNANDGNFIGQRPAGDLGTEMQFDLAPQGVPLWLSGLAFSPFRIDPGTGFGRLQVGVYDGDPETTARDVYEVPLTALGGGFFAPGPATRLLSLAAGTVNGLCYVPAGPFAGSLMYASFDAGEVRYLAIDAATGLALDSESGVPQLGTVDPVDHLFLSGLSVGPVGLDFDPLTNDLFISTYEGDPFNSIVQVGGFSSTTTTTSVPTTSTTSTQGTTTSTTTPPPACFDGPTFESISCRLDELVAQVRELTAAGPIVGKLERKLVSARGRLQSSQARIARGNVRGARGALGKAARLARHFRTILGSRKARGVPASTRSTLGDEALDIQTDLIGLKRGL